MEGRTGSKEARKSKQYVQRSRGRSGEVHVPRPWSSVTIQPPCGTNCKMLSIRSPHPCWDTAWGHMRTLVMLAKSDTSLVRNLTPYTESLHRGLESWPPQGSAAWEGSMLTHGQCRLSCGHSSICDCLTGGDWLFLLCHQMVLEFSDFGSTSKHTTEWRGIDWVTKKGHFFPGRPKNAKNMEWGRQSRWIWGKVMKETKTSLHTLP